MDSIKINLISHNYDIIAFVMVKSKINIYFEAFVAQIVLKILLDTIL
jgi:hypothetical protein